MIINMNKLKTSSINSLIGVFYVNIYIWTISSYTYSIQ